MNKLSAWIIKKLGGYTIQNRIIIDKALMTGCSFSNSQIDMKDCKIAHSKIFNNNIRMEGTNQL